MAAALNFNEGNRDDSHALLKRVGWVSNAFPEGSTAHETCRDVTAHINDLAGYLSAAEQELRQLRKLMRLRDEVCTWHDITMMDAFQSEWDEALAGDTGAQPRAKVW